MSKAFKALVLTAFAMVLCGTLCVADDSPGGKDGLGYPEENKWVDKADRCDHGKIEIPKPPRPPIGVAPPSDETKNLMFGSGLTGGFNASLAAGGSESASSKHIKDTRNVKNLIRRLG